MYLGIAVLIIGLVLLGVTLIRILGRGLDERARQWYALALAGVLLSIAGLILTLHGMKKVEKVPVATRETEPLAPQPVSPPELPPIPEPAKPATAEKIIEKPTSLIGKRREKMTRQLREEPDAEPYTKADFEYFDSQIKLIRNGFDQAIEETITGSPPPDKEHMSDAKLWKNFEFNHSVWVSNLRGKAAIKKGPGTAEIKKRIFNICDLSTKIQRVYHNSILWDREIDYEYIAQLENLIDKQVREIEEIEKERGFGD